jgi:hypothetical protein
VHFLERAGALASQAGAVAEAREHLRHAIELAPAAYHPRLYEALGDCAPFGDTTLDAYQRAVSAWRAETAPDARTGARLLRKLLGCLMRWVGNQSDGPNREEMIALRAEARRLAEEAGDEYEAWRQRVVDLFWSSWSGMHNREQARADMEVGWEAAAYFEAREDWAAFSEALDGYAVLARRFGDYRASADACQRRLASPALPILERGDAIGMLAIGYCDSGAYDETIEFARAVIAQRRPGDPAIALGGAPTLEAVAAYFTGRWSEISQFTVLEDDMWGDVGQEPGLGSFNWGHFLLMRVALAREDRSAAEREATIARSREKGISWRDTAALITAIISAELNGDATSLHNMAYAGVEPTTIRTTAFILTELNERGISIAPAFRDALCESALTRSIAYLGCFARIAFALADDDNAQLAEAIDAAEATHIIPHAARMRIVLAQRTGDRAPLARARPVLERLGDRQSLRRLEEVAAALK